MKLSRAFTANRFREDSSSNFAFKNNEYSWVCQLCFLQVYVTHSTPFTGININSLDFALKTWCFSYQKQVHLKKVMKFGQSINDFFRIFKLSYAKYWTRNVQNYLVYPQHSFVEMDETQVNSKSFTVFVKYP